MQPTAKTLMATGCYMLLGSETFSAPPPTPFQHPAFQILTESQVIEHRYRCTIAMPSLYWLHEMSCVPDWKKSKASLIQILEEKGNIPSDLKKKNIGVRANRAFAIASLLEQQIVNFWANKSSPRHGPHSLLGPTNKRPTRTWDLACGGRYSQMAHLLV